MAKATSTTSTLIPQASKRAAGGSTETQVTIPPTNGHPRVGPYLIELLNLGFTDIKITPTEPKLQGVARDDYEVDETIPAAGTGVDPSGIVQVIVFLPPNADD